MISGREVIVRSTEARIHYEKLVELTVTLDGVFGLILHDHIHSVLGSRNNLELSLVFDYII